MNLKKLFFWKKGKTRPENLNIHKRIGKDCSVVSSNLEEYTSIGDRCFVYNSHIDKFSYLSSNVTMMNTEVGRFTSIAQGAVISAGMHPSRTFVSTSPVFFSPHKQCTVTFSDSSYFEEMGKCKIGHDVWIGANSIIADNISIGNGAIVGAGAVVTKDVPPYAIVVGSPARTIRYRFNPEEIKFLLQFEWWNKEVPWLQSNFKDFHNISDFILKYGNQ